MAGYSDAPAEGSWGNCEADCCEEGARKGDYAYAGPGHGGWVRETRYRYVGHHDGDFQKFHHEARGPNCALCLCLFCVAGLAALLLYGGVHLLQNRPAKPTPPITRVSFNCVPGAMEYGERVMAAADIAFEPSGFVSQGSLGTVLEDDVPIGGAAGAEHVVTVSWDAIAGLQKSRVFRDMLLQVIEDGDKVETITSLTYRAPKGTGAVALAEDLEPAELVWSTKDLGDITKGTYGTVVALPPSAGLEQGTAMVRFVTQPDPVKVSQSNLIRAPQVGERVRAKLAIVAEAGDKPVQPGTVGTVQAVTSAENGFAFRFTVDWQGHVRTTAWEAELEPLPGSEGDFVEAGVSGTVLDRLELPPDGQPSEQRFVVALDGFPGPGAEIAHSQLRKSTVWSSEKKAFCAGRMPDEQVDEVEVETSSKPPPDLYSCNVEEESSWSLQQATWCCEHKGLPCKAISSPTTQGPKFLQPILVPSSFDPAPRTPPPMAVTTASPSGLPTARA